MFNIVDYIVDRGKKIAQDKLSFEKGLFLVLSLI